MPKTRDSRTADACRAAVLEQVEARAGELTARIAGALAALPAFSDLGPEADEALRGVVEKLLRT